MVDFDEALDDLSSVPPLDNLDFCTFGGKIDPPTKPIEEIKLKVKEL